MNPLRAKIGIWSEVEIEGLFDEVPTRILRDELHARGDTGQRDIVMEAVSMLRRGATGDAIALLEREFAPKFPSVEACERSVYYRDPDGNLREPMFERLVPFRGAA